LGPVYDRIDILLYLQSIKLDQPSILPETSIEIRKRVEKARQMQYERYQADISNAKVHFEQIILTSPLTEAQQRMIGKVAAKQN
jgi:magnesium chelatase family protein